jgi:hypothetical protein
VGARIAFMGSHGSDKHEISLPQQKLHFIDRPVLHENRDVTHKLRDTIAHAGFVPDHNVFREVIVTSTVVTGDMKSLLVVAH